MRYPSAISAVALTSTFLSLPAITLAGQAPATTASEATKKKGTSSQTIDGHPDLQGVWDYRTLTPLQRPDNLAGKKVLTDDEAAALEKSVAATRVDKEPPQGSPGTYNQFWFDFGTKVVTDKRTSLIVDPPDGRLPPLTEEGKKRAAARRDAMRRMQGPEARPAFERCIVGFSSGPPIIPNGYNNNLQLFVTHDYAVILTEMIHEARIIPLVDRPRLRPSVRQWMGDSHGRWEGDTLVVETTNFTDDGTALWYPLQVPLDQNLHLVERFRRADADTLLYQFTVNDPSIWTKPWSAVVEMKKNQDRMYEYACHEGNHGMVGMLGGARADERAAAEAAKNKK